MQTLNFSTTINAPKELVRKTMLDKPTYEERTTPFSEGSTYIGSREQGADIKFTDQAGQGGMKSQIAECRLNEFVSIKSLGEFATDPETGEIKEKLYPEDASIFENYSFSENDGVTTLDVSLSGLPDEYAAMFDGMRPNALKKLKEMCER